MKPLHAILLTLLCACTASAADIVLKWKDNSTNEKGFAIERADAGSDGFVEIARVGQDVATYRDTELAPLTTYRYRVRAGNDSGWSAYSNIAEGTTRDDPPAAPGLESVEPPPPVVTIDLPPGAEVRVRAGTP